jgi:hypothetical protein
MVRTATPAKTAPFALLLEHLEAEFYRINVPTLFM